jgi:hypothetical protein
MIGITCNEERFQFRQWLLSVNARAKARLALDLRP